jgi:hypothetical protein
MPLGPNETLPNSEMVVDPDEKRADGATLVCAIIQT